MLFLKVEQALKNNTYYTYTYSSLVIYLARDRNRDRSKTIHSGVNSKSATLKYKKVMSALMKIWYLVAILVHGKLSSVDILGWYQNVLHVGVINSKFETLQDGNINFNYLLYKPETFTHVHVALQKEINTLQRYQPHKWNGVSVFCKDDLLLLQLVVFTCIIIGSSVLVSQLWPTLHILYS